MDYDTAIDFRCRCLKTNGELNMTKVVITRTQYEKIKEIFEMYDEVDRIVWKEESVSGIGPNVTISYEPKTPVKVDITDYASW